MHICIISHEYPKPGFPHGGIGSFLKTIAPKLVENGIKVTIVGLSYENKYEFEEDRGVEIFRLKYFNPKRLGWFFAGKAIAKKITEIHKNSPIDVVEASELGLAFVKKEKGIKYIIRLHGGHHFFAEAENRKINFWKGFQEKRAFKKADAFIAISKYVKSHTEKFLSFHNKPVCFINNIIDTDFFKPIDTIIKKHSVLFMGSVCEKKGVRQLIQSFPIVKSKFPDATLQIYGRDWFFPDGKSFIEYLKKDEISKMESISNDIYFHGQINYEDVPDKYSKAQVCVFPSHMETQGLVAPEAMSMQKNVIFTEKGPGKETITEYETGLLCNPFDPNDIAEKIIWVFSNEEKAEEIAINARKSILEKFSSKIIVKKNIDFYNKVIYYK